MRVRYIGHFGHMSGYGMAAYDMLAAFHRAGIELSIIPRQDSHPEKVPARFRHLSPFVEDARAADPNWQDVTFVHSVPPQAPLFLSEVPQNGQPAVLYTTWETNRPPRDFDGTPIELLGELFQAVLLPCTWNARSWIAAGVKGVWPLPHAFDPDWWTERPELSTTPRRRADDEVTPTPGRAPSDNTVVLPAVESKLIADTILQSPVNMAKLLEYPYTFYSIVGGWNERKNPLGLLKAYLTEFKSVERVLLRIVTSFYDQEEVEALKKGLGFESFPAVEFVGKDSFGLTDEEIRDIHYRSDCYVTAARAEGWGLGAFEAAAMGNPVIAPNYGAFQDHLFDLTDPYRVLYRCFETPAVVPPARGRRQVTMAGMTFTPVVLNIPRGVQGDQMWAEPDLMELRRHMRFAFEERYRSGTRPWRFEERFGYAAVAKKFIEIAEGLRG